MACGGILSNFESQLRPRNYVTSKVVNTACEIVLGNTEKIGLGNYDITRGSDAAEDIMTAVSLTLRQKSPDDYIIATGISHSLVDFLEITFSIVEPRLSRSFDFERFLNTSIGYKANAL
jgi:GDPmannose 4,6-dehydratase